MYRDAKIEHRNQYYVRHIISPFFHYSITIYLLSKPPFVLNLSFARDHQNFASSELLDRHL